MHHRRISHRIWDEAGQHCVKQLTDGCVRNDANLEVAHVQLAGFFALLSGRVSGLGGNHLLRHNLPLHRLVLYLG